MSDTFDQELRRVAHALVADAPTPPAMPRPARAAEEPVHQNNARRPVLWVAAAAALVAVVVMAGAVAGMRGEGPAGPVFAAVQVPRTVGTGSPCADVDETPAPESEAAKVRFEPAPLPAGYVHRDPYVPVRQTRRAPSQCWTAEISFVDASSSRMLVAAASREGLPVQGECQIPESRLPDRCVTVNGAPASLSVDGERRALTWAGADDAFVHVSGYGLSEEELVAAAETFVWTSNDVAMDAPDGMTEVEAHAGGTQGETVGYVAQFVAGDGSEPHESSVLVRITTWNDLAVSDAGPVTAVDVHGVTGLLVGQPGFPAEDQWTGSVDESAADWPGRMFLVWKKDGVDFLVEGPDAATVVAFARALDRPGR